jgi:catalase
VETPAIRLRMLAQLANIHADLHAGVALALGMKEKEQPIQPKVAPRDLPPSPPLSILAKAPKILEGRKLGVLITDGFSGAALKALKERAKAEKAAVMVIAPKVGGATDDTGVMVPADQSLTTAPSLLFDSVTVLASQAGAEDLANQAPAVDWVRDAFGHLKVIARSPEALVLFEKAGVKPDDGVIDLGVEKGLETYFDTAKAGRIWAREPGLRRPG